MPAIHALRVEDVFAALETTPHGLPPTDAQTRLNLYGRNALTTPPRESVWRRVWLHLQNPLARLLWVGAVLAALISAWELITAIVLVVLMNAAFSLWQEYRAEQAAAKLAALLPTYARVQRDATEQMLPASEIVPGDVLIFAEGDHIAADARVIEEYGLCLNTATLNGEASAVRKTAEASLRDGLTEVERPNLVFAGTSVAAGTGRAVVYATGMATQFGRIARLTQATPEPPSQLRLELNYIAAVAWRLVVGIGLATLFVELQQWHMAINQALLFAIGLIVAVAPKGLTPTVTMALAMAARRLAHRHIMVKKLTTVETLGMISVLCTDKSGTLTQNQMTVRAVWVNGQRLNVTGVGYAPRGEFVPEPQAPADLRALLLAATLCNNARLTPPSPQQPLWSALGDQTEAALRVAARKGGVEETAANREFPRIHELPFDARRKRMSTIHQQTDGTTFAMTKGAPREVIQLCDSILLNGETRPLDNATRAALIAANDDYARGGLRVLALARRALPPRTGAYNPDTIEQQLTFLGLLAMMDPPRPEVENAVKICRQAGIRLVMITGDYGLTAESIARRLGMLAVNSTPRILTGADLEALDDLALQVALTDEVIFARMAPEHKLRVVAAFQALGEVVAVTGDGVNDAPALRKADVGIAMGLTGTDVAKDAADVVLANDNFAAIVTAIEYGRAVYANLRKFLIYLFASNLPELAPFILSSLFHLPMALTVWHLLAIDLGTNVIPALALSAEHPEPDLMKHKPRRRNARLLDRTLFVRSAWLGALETLLCYSGYFLVFASQDLSAFNLPPLMDWATPLGGVYALATTVYFTGVLAAQIGAAFACRTDVARVHEHGLFNNRLLLLGLALEATAIVFLIAGAPLIKPLKLFGLSNPQLFASWVVLYAPVVYGLDRIRKSVARHWARRAGGVA